MSPFLPDYKISLRIGNYRTNNEHIFSEIVEGICPILINDGVYTDALVLPGSLVYNSPLGIAK